MTFNRALLLLAIMVVCGSVQVTQQTAIRLLAYEVGKRSQRLYEFENETRWLKTQVIALQSPVHLARSMKDQHVELVAWSALPSVSQTQPGAPASVATHWIPSSSTKQPVVSVRVSHKHGTGLAQAGQSAGMNHVSD